MLKYSFPHIERVYSSAGAGKTHELSLRYVLFLLSPYIEKSDFRNMLAITFSNPAAHEMKERILDWLKRAALDLNVRKGKERVRELLSRELGLSKEEVGRLARERIEEILNNYPYFQVRTIDSFMRNIMVASALDMGLPPRFDIITDGRPYIAYLLDMIVSLAGDDIEGDEHVGKLIEFLELSLALDAIKGWTPKKELRRRIEEFQEIELNSGKAFKDVEIDEFIRLQDELRKAIANVIELLEEKGAQDSVIEKWRQFKLKVEENKYKELTSSFINRLKATKTEGDLILGMEISSILNRLLPKYLYYASRTRFKAYVDFYSSFKTELEKFKKERRLVFISELNSKVRDYIKEGNLVPEIYYKLGEELRHFLIDEFQDTNTLQWENIKPLVEEALSRGGSLYVVGDVKQAIYGFRGGRADLFERLREEFPQVGGNLRERKKDENYRSLENIIKFAEYFFDEERLEKILTLFKLDNLPPEVKPKYDVKQIAIRGKGGYIRVEAVENKEEAIEKTIEILKEDILKRYDPGNVAILLRRQREVEEFTQALTKAHIRVTSDVTLNVKSDPLIREIVSLLKFLDSPVDNLSFASFILGEIFTSTANMEKESIHTFLEDWALTNSRNIPLYRAFRERFPKYWSRYFDRLFRSVGFLPPYDLIDLIYRIYDLRSRFREREALYTHLLEIAHILEERGLNNVKDFLDVWEEARAENELFQIPVPESRSSIKILTMHKSKGLEFEVVILPYFNLYSHYVSPTFKGSMILEEEDGLSHFSFSKEISINSPELAKIYMKEKIKKTVDELNLAYVSITRAKNELYIFVPKRIGIAWNAYYISILGDKNEIFEMGERLKRLPTVEKEEEQPITERKEGEWFARLVDESVKRGIESLRRREAIRRGEVVHSILSRIKNGIEEKEVERLVEEELRSKRYSFNKEEILRLVIDTLNLPVVSRTINSEGEIFTEYEVVSRKGEHYIMDRVYVEKERVTVLEYKTGEEYSEEHVAQVKNYLGLLNELYPGKKLEGYLVYIDERKVVKVPWER